jgi:hypothetical protein
MCATPSWSSRRRRQIAARRKSGVSSRWYSPVSVRSTSAAQGRVAEGGGDLAPELAVADVCARDVEGVAEEGVFVSGEVEALFDFVEAPQLQRDANGLLQRAICEASVTVSTGGG